MMCIQEAIAVIYERERKRSKHMSAFCERECKKENKCLGNEQCSLKIRSNSFSKILK